jgi:hypothetical protein
MCRVLLPLFKLSGLEQLLRFVSAAGSEGNTEDYGPYVNPISHGFSCSLKQDRLSEILTLFISASTVPNSSRTFSASCHLDAIAWCLDRFASTMWTAAWAGETAAVVKDKVALLAACRVQNESPCLVARDGLHDVNQMFLDLSLGKPQHLRQLIRR